MILTDIFSTGGKIVPVETLPGVRCPVCGHSAKARLFRSDHTLRALGVTILRRRTSCFAVCASCGGVFEPMAKRG